MSAIFNSFMRAYAINELLQCGGLTSGNMRGLLIRVDFLIDVDGNEMFIKLCYDVNQK